MALDYLGIIIVFFVEQLYGCFIWFLRIYKEMKKIALKVAFIRIKYFAFK